MSPALSRGLLLLAVMAGAALLFVRSSEPDVEGAAVEAVPVEPSPSAGDPTLFGIIEIGGSGVKPSVVRLTSVDGTVEPDVVAQLPDLEADAHDRDSIPIVAQAVRRNAATMADQHGVPTKNIYVLGSSGVERLPHQAEIKAAVDAAVGTSATALEFISAEAEGELGFEGVVNCVKMARRRGQVLFVDIGSSNTKATYVTNPEAACGTEDHENLDMPYGTKVFARQASEVGGDFPEAIDMLRGGMLAAMKTEAEAHPGVRQRPLVYLGGGIAWALATLTHPEDKRRYVRLTVRDIAALRDQLRDDPSCITDTTKGKQRDADCVHLDVDMSRVADQAQREASTSDYEKVVNKVFTAEQLMAGVEVLDTMAAEWAFDKKHNLFFARPARRAWMVGFILQKHGVDNLAMYYPPK